ncbi:reverse transcriptase domain-containing protein [Tanacetum coccineum]
MRPRVLMARAQADANQPRGKGICLCSTFRIQNNKAEYEALLAGLWIAQEMEIRSLAIFADSQLMVKQIKGLFEAIQQTIKQYLQKVKEIMKGFDSYMIEHIRRNQNKKVDALRKLASMTFEHLTKEVLVEVLAKKSIDDREVSKIEAEKGENWTTPIYEYLLSGLLPEDPKELSKIIVKAPQYKLVKGSQYKKSFLTSWLCCIGPSQAESVIKEIHEGSCGFNTKPHSMVFKITMYRDAAKIIQDCIQSQE